MTAIQKQLPRWAETLSGHPEFSLPGLDGRGTGSHIDQLVCRERTALLGGGGAGLAGAEPGGEGPTPIEPANERVYYCQNWRADVVALAGDSGQMVEWAKYSSYGVPFGLPAGDTDSDGDADVADITQINTWINTSTYDVRGDLDLDGDVDATDATLFSSGPSGESLGRGTLSRSDVSNRKGYAGYENDGNIVEFYHVRHRVLNTTLGRWMQRDPIGYRGGSNFYSYVAGQPTRLVDASGLIGVAPGGPGSPGDRECIVPFATLGEEGDCGTDDDGTNDDDDDTDTKLTDQGYIPIRVRCTKIPIPGGSHCYIEYNPPGGPKRTCSGHPSTPLPPFGPIRAKCYPWGPGNPDKNLLYQCLGVPPKPIFKCERSTQISCPANTDYDALWKCMEDVMKAIDECEIKYQLKGPNSNTTLNSALAKCLYKHGCNLTTSPPKTPPGGCLKPLLDCPPGWNWQPDDPTEEDPFQECLQEAGF